MRCTHEGGTRILCLVIWEECQCFATEFRFEQDVYWVSACVFKRRVVALRVSPFPLRIFCQLAAVFHVLQLRTYITQVPVGAH